MRSFSLVAREKILREAKLLCEKIAEAYGLIADAVVIRQYPVTINNTEHAQFVVDTAIDVFGKDAYLPMEFPVAGAEDFSRVLLETPGSYMFLGACTTDDYATAASNHSALATFDDSVLHLGARMHTELAIRALRRK